MPWSESKNPARASVWYWDNLNRWDVNDRNEAKVYLGEWAAHDGGRRRTLRAAIAEAACWTSLERNGDIVSMASYAPLLARNGNTQWNPDLIYFTNTDVLPTLSYQVQKLLGQNGGDRYLETKVENVGGRFAASTVADSQSGDVIIKLVNGDAEARTVRIEFKGRVGILPQAMKTVLSGSNANKVNTGRADVDGEILPVVDKLRTGSLSVANLKLLESYTLRSSVAYRNEEPLVYEEQRVLLDKPFVQGRN